MARSSCSFLSFVFLHSLLLVFSISCSCSSLFVFSSLCLCPFSESYHWSPELLHVAAFYRNEKFKCAAPSKKVTLCQPSWHGAGSCVSQVRKEQHCPERFVTDFAGNTGHGSGKLSTKSYFFRRCFGLQQEMPSQMRFHQHSFLQILGHCMKKKILKYRVLILEGMRSQKVPNAPAKYVHSMGPKRNRFATGARSACRFCSKKPGQNRAAIRCSSQSAGTRALLRTEKFLEGLNALPEILGRLQSFSPKSGCCGVGWGTN